jgi:hypothetical protein
VGEADPSDVVGSLDRTQLADSVACHCLDVDWKSAPMPYKSAYAWVLQKAARYRTEFRYDLAL